MSTPVISEERQAAAEAVLGVALDIAVGAEREATHAVREKAPVARDALYALQVCPPHVPGTSEVPGTYTVCRVPLILPPGVTGVAAAEAAGNALPATLADRRPLPDGRQAAELLLLLEPTGAGQRVSSDRQTI